MKDIIGLIGFTFVSGIFSVMGRGIGKVITKWFPEIGIVSNSSFGDAFLNGITFGLAVGLFWIIIGGRFLAGCCSASSPDEIKPIIKLITAAYMVAALVIGNLPAFI